MLIQQINKEYNTLNTIPLEEVGEKLHLKNKGAIRKWLDAEKIKINKLGKMYYVYEIEVDFALNKPFVTSIKYKHPDKWKQIYKTVCKNEYMYDYTVSILDGDHEYTPLTSVSPLSNKDNILLKQLSK